MPLLSAELFSVQAEKSETPPAKPAAIGEAADRNRSKGQLISSLLIYRLVTAPTGTARGFLGIDSNSLRGFVDDFSRTATMVASRGHIPATVKLCDPPGKVGGVALSRSWTLDDPSYWQGIKPLASQFVTFRTPVPDGISEWH